MNRQIKISVIMPACNVEAYIGDSLNSLICQTDPFWECLCMNDGSQDRTLEILRKYEEVDTRIRVFTQENQGLTRTLNTLLEKVDGGYLFFLDSDDYIHPQTFEILRKIIERIDVDVAECSVCRTGAAVPDSYQMIYSDSDCANVVVLRDMSIFLSKEKRKGSWINKWNKLYRFEKISNLRFSECITYEDDYFYASQVNTRISSKALVGLALYYYRKNPNGITGNVDFEKYISSGINRIWLSYDYFIAQGRVPVSYRDDFMAELAKDACRMIVKKSQRKCRDKQLRKRLFKTASCAMGDYVARGVVCPRYLSLIERLIVWSCIRGWYGVTRLLIFLT